MKIFRTPFALITLSCLCPLQAFGAGVRAKYVVGYATYTARIAPLWLAQEQGFFTKYGIDVDPVFIRGAPTWSPAWPPAAFISGVPAAAQF